MKFKKDLILLGIMAIVAAAFAGMTMVLHDTDTENTEKMKITASFYPVYILALNLTDGMDDVEVFCMTQNQTGCLHDYQITTKDMKVLENSDVFLINGGGMESFLGDVTENYPSLPVVDTGEEVERLLQDEHEHEDELSHTDGHNHENAHFWLHPAYYCIQIQAAADGLSALNPLHESQYQENARQYIEKVTAMASKMQAEFAQEQQAGVIVFHDAFVYLAEYLGMNVVHTVDMDGETSLSAGEIAAIIDEVKEQDIQVLFTEAQYGTKIADTISAQTGAVSFVIDSLVTGDEDKNAYLRGMESNLVVLEQAAAMLYH